MNIRMSGLAIAVLALSASAAFAEVDTTPEMKAKIEEMLKAQGYEVGKIKVGGRQLRSLRQEGR